MRRKISLFLVAIVALIALAACNGSGNVNENDYVLKMLEVEFNVPDAIEVGETLELKAIVTYGDEKVTDADEVEFEVWEKGDRENSVDYTGENNGDGTYTVEVTFDHDGIFEMYAHTTARDMHTMPLREIVVGEGGDYDDIDDSQVFHTEGFDLDFMNVENAKVGEEVDLIIHVTIDEEHLADARVRYEIWQENDEDNTAWIDAVEENDVYVAKHIFDEAGTYNIQIHVEDDKDLHEHAQYEIEVTE